MGRLRKGREDQDRYIFSLNGNYYYRRRVPTELRDSDGRGPLIKISLKTSDLAKARSLRDAYEAADDELWFSMASGGDVGAAHQRYQAAVKRVRAMGFSYRSAVDISREPVETILERIETMLRPGAPKPVIEAAIGAIDEPKLKLSEAFNVYLEKIAPHQIRGKSAGQKKRWANVKRLALDSFTEVVGDLMIDAITREDARKYYDYWMAKIAPKVGAPTHTASSGNRRVGDLRVLYREYYQHLGQPDRRNPFDGMSFREKTKRKRKRPSFPLDWITGTILKPGNLATMNDQARAIVLTVADVGARPSEICNLTPDHIVLDHKIPHLIIEPRDDPEDPREIKTESSIRIVPLTGVALAAMRKHPNGFPKYKDKEDSLSAALNKYLRDNKLLPSTKHSVYSFRHSFEDRMKDAHVDAELRKILMGHSIDRPEYGEGGSLKLRLDAMKLVALPFDPSIV